MQLWERRKRMGDNNVASIGKMLMQTQSGQSVTGVDGADIGTTFRKMVDQMTQIPGSSVSTGSQTAQNMQQLTPHSPGRIMTVTSIRRIRYRSKARRTGQPAVGYQRSWKALKRV